MARKRQPIREDQLHHWNLLEQFRRRVLPLLKAKATLPTEEDVRRTLFAEDYFCSYLFAMLNPVITSMRSLCHVSHCRKMRRVSAAPISPAAFSEGQHVFDPEILEKVVRQLAQENQGRGHGGDARVRQALRALTAVDGTVLRAVPRMAWAPAAGPVRPSGCICILMFSIRYRKPGPSRRATCVSARFLPRPWPPAA